MKKKFVLIITLVFCMGVFNVSAQKIKGAIIGGTNLSQVDGDEVFGFRKLGWNVGVAAIVPIGNNFSLSLENSFSQKGAYQKTQYSDSIYSGEYSLKLNYVEIPVMIHYTDRDIITVGTGLAWARLLSADEEENSGATTPYTDQVKFNKNDLLWKFDIRFRLIDKLKMNIQYSYSLKNIRERVFTPPSSNEEWSRKQYNNLITFRLIYVFNEKPSLKKSNTN
ncbi:MAG: outer membrane beta-barrel protein [Bacteroidota bacterium]|nr:outer membrane beta-barrel protein [Bacteroidota bacterium]